MIEPTKECACEEMTCKEGCELKHTHKVFWCEKCHPERYEPLEEKKCKHDWIFETINGEDYKKLCSKCGVIYILKETPKDAFVIVPSGRIDYCCECDTEHGYNDCPKDKSPLEPKPELKEEQFWTRDFWTMCADWNIEEGRVIEDFIKLQIEKAKAERDREIIGKLYSSNFIIGKREGNAFKEYNWLDKDLLETLNK